MKKLRTPTVVAVLCAMASIAPASASAQLGRQQGLIEPNVATDSAMRGLLSMNAGAAQALKAARPILSAVTLDSILASRSISQAQRAALYRRMFVHVDLNRGTDAELLLVPGVDAKTLAAIKSGRPYKTLEQFRAVATKATNAAEAQRLEQYFFIPVDLNTFTDPIMDTFASIGVGTRQWKHEFAEYRPWTSMEQFDRNIGKYVRGRPSELQRLKRYVIINK